MDPASALCSRPATFRAGMPPLLLVIVHTEEEFDWSKPFDRAHNSVANLKELGRGQELFARHGVKPTYMIDYPVASQDEGIRAVAAVAAGSDATIGAHLHPWVNPPFDEIVSSFHSFPGNLPRELEREKLLRLADRIAAAFGMRPVDYLAGRHGRGANTVSILQELGFRSDLSVVAMTDFRAEGGPDFTARGNLCCWDGDPPILRIPHNVADVGYLCRDGRRLFAADGHALLRRIRLPGILSRCGAMTRIRLTPEGFELEDLKACARALVASGAEVLIFSFHSPSLVPGLTPYVRDRADLAEFAGRIDGFLRFFKHDIGGAFGGPGDALAAARAISAGGRANHPLHHGRNDPCDVLSQDVPEGQVRRLEVAPFRQAQVSVVIRLARVIAHIRPGLGGAVEVNDPGTADDVRDLIVGQPERIGPEIEGRDDVPDVGQRHPVVIEATIERVLVGIAQRLPVADREVEHPIERGFFAPSLQVEEHHSGIEVAVSLRNIERSATGRSRNRNRAEHAPAKVGSPKRADVVHHDHIAIEIEDPFHLRCEKLRNP